MLALVLVACVDVDDKLMKQQFVLAFPEMMKLENHDGHMRSVCDSLLTQLTLTGMLEEQVTQGVH